MGNVEGGTAAFKRLFCDAERRAGELKRAQEEAMEADLQMSRSTRVTPADPEHIQKLHDEHKTRMDKRAEKQKEAKEEEMREIKEYRITRAIDEDRIQELYDQHKK